MTKGLRPIQNDVAPYQSAYTPPTLGIVPQRIRAFVYNSGTYRTIMNALRQEVFRKGFVVEQCFDSKCTGCGATYEYVEETCEFCGNDCYTPPTNLREDLEKWIEKANDTQSLKQVMEMLEENFNIFDNAYLVLDKTYGINGKTGEIVTAEITGLYSGDPIHMRKIINAEGYPGFQRNTPTFVCPVHRDQISHTLGQRCQTCNAMMYRAYYAQVSFTAAMEAKPLTYFIEGEVIHRTKFTPTIGYGIPPALTLFKKINTLIQEDDYLMRMFSEKKPPKGALFIKTQNKESVYASWKTMVEKATSNPQMIFPMTIPAGDDSKGKFAEYIDFMRSLNELEFTQHRDEFRKAIGSFFGVAPLFLGDTSASGGLNNERLQIVVTNRSIEQSQEGHNWILKQFVNELGIDSWTIALVPSEDRDEMNDLMIEQQKLQNAQLFKSLGYRPILQPNGDFAFEYDESLEAEQELEGIGFEETSPLDLSINQPQKLDGDPDTLKSLKKRKVAKKKR